MGLKEALKARAEIVKKVAGGDLEKSVLDFLPEVPPASVMRVMMELERELIGLVSDGGGPLTKRERVDLLESDFYDAIEWAATVIGVDIAERWNVTE